MNIAVLEFFINNSKLKEFNKKRVLEIGSRYINGSVRPLIEKFFSPKEYVGIDWEPGKFVDVVLLAEKSLEYFGPESFDVVIATELLEHIKNWRLVIKNMKGVLKSNGYIYITTRSRGFPYHGYPYDFWRYEIEDIKTMFADFELLALKKDPEAPGVFLKAKKPKRNITPIDLSNNSLYSMILDRRIKRIIDIADMPLAKRIKMSLSTKFRKWIKFVLKLTK